MDGFLKAYIAKFRYGTVTTEQWKQFLLEYFHKEVVKLYVLRQKRIEIYIQVSNGVLEEVEWEKWIREPGMPPLKPMLVHTVILNACV